MNIVGRRDDIQFADKESWDLSLIGEEEVRVGR